MTSLREKREERGGRVGRREGGREGEAVKVLRNVLTRCNVIPETGAVDVGRQIEQRLLKQKRKSSINKMYKQQHNNNIPLSSSALVCLGGKHCVYTGRGEQV